VAPLSNVERKRVWNRKVQDDVSRYYVARFDTRRHTQVMVAESMFYDF